jgi:hypothetical protein
LIWFGRMLFYRRSLIQPALPEKMN